MTETGEAVVMLWFVVAILVEVGSTVILWSWLRRRGVRLVFAWTGVPGYLERAYVDWCRRHDRRGVTIVIFRVISLVNVVAAAIVMIPILAAK